MTSIGVAAFDKTAWFDNQPDGLVYAGKVAYKYKGTMPEKTSITLDDGTLGIADCAFYNCSGLTSVTIPNSVTSIGNYAFYYCSGLTSVTIGNSVTSIGFDAFSGTAWYNNQPDGLVYAGKVAYKYKGTMPANTSITLDDGTLGIVDNAFAGCSGLTSVTIPTSVTSIGNYAFYNCSGLTSVTVEIETPLPIYSNTFSNRTNTTLYVPAGSKSAYESATYWKEFKEIVEVANIGDPTANTISIADITVNRGKQVVLPIALNNQQAITGLQMDLYLPAGVSVAKKANGKMMIETTDRMDGNYTISSNTIDNYVRIVGYSGDGDAFTGNSGDILNVTLDVSETMEAGNYAIRIKDIVLSDVNSTEYHPADVEATLTVKSYTLGDVDDSGAININDVVCIINHILNKPNGTFIADAADVDGSGTININDVVTLINRYILMKESAPAVMSAPRLGDIETNNYLYLADIEIAPNETKEIQMLLTNANEAKGVQGNIKLPDGLSFVTKANGKVDAKNIDARAEDFTLSCSIQSDGSLTFAHYSGDGFAYEGSNGGIFTFKIKADENAKAGTYAVNLTGVVLSIGGVGYDIPGRTSSLTVTGASGLSELESVEPFDVYTLDGILLRSKATTLKGLPAGVYIVNGRQVVIK